MYLGPYYNQILQPSVYKEYPFLFHRLTHIKTLHPTISFVHPCRRNLVMNSGSSAKMVGGCTTPTNHPESILSDDENCNAYVTKKALSKKIPDHILICCLVPNACADGRFTQASSLVGCLMSPSTSPPCLCKCAKRSRLRKTASKFAKTTWSPCRRELLRKIPVETHQQLPVGMITITARHFTRLPQLERCMSTTFNKKICQGCLALNMSLDILMSTVQEMLSSNLMSQGTLCLAKAQ